MSATVTTIATRKVTMKMTTMTPITSKTRVKAINKIQQDSKVDSLKLKLYEHARAMKHDGQPINLSSIAIPSIFYVHY